MFLEKANTMAFHVQQLLTLNHLCKQYRARSISFDTPRIPGILIIQKSYQQSSNGPRVKYNTTTIQLCKCLFHVLRVFLFISSYIYNVAMALLCAVRDVVCSERCVSCKKSSLHLLIAATLLEWIA